MMPSAPEEFPVIDLVEIPAAAHQARMPVGDFYRYAAEAGIVFCRIGKTEHIHAGQIPLVVDAARRAALAAEGENRADRRERVFGDLRRTLGGQRPSPRANVGDTAGLDEKGRTVAAHAAAGTVEELYQRKAQTDAFVEQERRFAEGE